MKANVMDINALPSLLFRLFSTAKVAVSDVINASNKGNAKIIMHKANLLEVYKGDASDSLSKLIEGKEMPFDISKVI